MFSHRHMKNKLVFYFLKYISLWDILKNLEQRFQIKQVVQTERQMKDIGLVQGFEYKAKKCGIRQREGMKVC